MGGRMKKEEKICHNCKYNVPSRIDEGQRDYCCVHPELVMLLEQRKELGCSLWDKR